MRKRGEKIYIFEEIIAPQISKLNKNYTFTNLKISKNFKHKKHKENYSKAHHKLAENLYKKKLLKTLKNRHDMYKGTKIKMILYFLS